MCVCVKCGNGVEWRERGAKPTPVSCTAYARAGLGWVGAYLAPLGRGSTPIKSNTLTNIAIVNSDVFCLIMEYKIDGHNALRLSQCSARVKWRGIPRSCKRKESHMSSAAIMVAMDQN